MYDLKYVIDCVLYLYKKDKKTIAPLPLMNMLYYCQAWSLVLDDTKLFEERIIAGIHGAFIIEVFDLRAEANKQRKRHKPSLPIVDEVYDVYGVLDCNDLESLVQKEKPWQKAWKGLQPFDTGIHTISLSDMKSYYRKRLDEENNV